eukprot:11492908-Heterocapsa_arctica.AAC.1
MASECTWPILTQGCVRRKRVAEQSSIILNSVGKGGERRWVSQSSGRDDPRIPEVGPTFAN